MYVEVVRRESGYLSLFCQLYVKYLGSSSDANGGAEKDVSNRVKIALSKWRETTGVMCDRNISTKLKDEVYKTAIQPVMTYVAEC